MRIGRMKKIVFGTSGAEIAEAAVVLPLLFMIMFGIYWFGRAYNIYATINHAAREGARVASAPTCASCGNNFDSVDAIADRVAQALQASKLDPAQVTHSGGNRVACGGGTSACSTPSGGKPNICVYFNVQLDTPAAGPAGCGVGVSFQYPYKFYFPFTSLHMQRVNLPADVQMVGEN